MAKVVGRPPDIVREGKRLILPEGMSYADARTWLERQEMSEEQETRVSRQFKAFPLDGAAALARAIDRLYGWAEKRAVPGMFGSSPPETVSLPVAGGETLEVPWGRFVIPGIAGWVSGSMTRNRDGLPVYVMHALTKEKDKPKVVALFDAVQDELAHASIYRGQAIRFEFPDPDDEYDPHVAPEFLDLSRVDPGEVVLRNDVMELVETTVFTPLRYTATLRMQGIPLKRGILLEGPYGVGKTLLAYATAQNATANGWTFLYAKVGQIAQAIEFALLYEPCVIFAEDVDQVLGTDERSENVNDVLNTIDGVNVKGREVMVILTTNHVERINQAMLRYGRLDTIISIPPPDAEAAGRLVALYARDQLEPGINLEPVGRELAGQIPAMVREVVERAKLGAIARGRGPGLRLSAHDLTVAARGMVRHQALLKPKVEDTRSDLERAAGIVADALVVGSMKPRRKGMEVDDRGRVVGALSDALVDGLDMPTNGHGKGV